LTRPASPLPQCWSACGRLAKHRNEDSGGSSVPESPEGIAGPSRRAIAYHRQGQLTDASAAHREVISRDPDEADALQLLGVASYQLGGLDEAVERIERSLAVMGFVVSAGRPTG